MHLYIDFIGNQSVFALTERPEKIAANLDRIPPLKDDLAERRKTATTGISIITVFGRWIVVYQGDLEESSEALMYFIDFRFNIEDIVTQTFSKSTAAAILKTQSRYDQKYSSSLDTVEVCFAELYEQILSTNVFACDQDDRVLQKAKELGVLPIIETLKAGDSLKVCFADEKLQSDSGIVTNVYALLHFGGHAPEEQEQNGFAYLKLYDVKNNLSEVDVFLSSLQATGAQFDRAILLEKFTTIRSN